MRVYLMRHVLWRWRGSEAGQDLLEYALLVSLIVLAAIAAINTLGLTLKTVFWDAIAAAKF
jgi:Flp pilus assembly pilin Flp